MEAFLLFGATESTQVQMVTRLWQRPGFQPFRRSGTLEREKPPGRTLEAFLLFGATVFTQVQMVTRLWQRPGFQPFRRSGSLEREKPPRGTWEAFLYRSTLELFGRRLWQIELSHHFINPISRAAEKANEQDPDAIA